MKKRILSLFLAFALFLSCFTIPHYNVYASPGIVYVKDIANVLIHAIGSTVASNVTDDLYDWLVTKLSGEADEDGKITTVHLSESGNDFGGGHGRYFGIDDSGNLHIHQNYLNEVLTELREQCTKLNGYYLFESVRLREYPSEVAGFYDDLLRRCADYINSEYSYDLIFSHSSNTSGVWNLKVGESLTGSCLMYGVNYGFFLGPSSNPDLRIGRPGTVFAFGFKCTNDNGSYVLSDFELIESRTPNFSYDNYTITSFKYINSCFDYITLPFKVFYSQSDYNAYKNSVLAGNKPPVVYAPVYNGGDVVINHTVINGISNGTITRDDLKAAYDAGKASAGNINIEYDDMRNQLIIDRLFELYLQKIKDETGAVDPTPPESESESESESDSETESESETETGGTGSDTDYKRILEEICRLSGDINTNVSKLNDMFREFMETGKCEYDFNELKNYLDIIYKENESQMQSVIVKLETNNNYFLEVLKRLDDIYERLSLLPNYSDVLTEILSHLANGDYKLEDVLQSISDAALASNNKLDSVVNNLVQSNSYFNTLLSTLPSLCAQKYDDAAMLDKLDDIIKELKINNEYNKEMLEVLDNIESLMKSEQRWGRIKDRASECANKASEVFPTCVPWDLARFLNALAADPETPVIEVPIEIESLNIEETFTIDLHFFDNYVAKFRILVTLLFVMALMIMTMKYYTK